MTISSKHHSIVGKVAIVTGSARGIGKEIANILAREGARVLVTGTDEERTKVAATKIAEQTGADTNYYVGDLSLEENVSAMVEKTINKWNRIDILVAVSLDHSLNILQKRLK